MIETTRTSNVRGMARKRPGKYKRNAQDQAKNKTTATGEGSQSSKDKDKLPLKRKTEDEAVDAPKPTKLKASEMVPKEGPSKA